MPVERDRPPDHIWIAVELLLPIVVTEHNHRIVTRNLPFAAQKEPPGSRFQTKPVEEVPADVRGHNPIRLLPWYGECVDVDGGGEDVAEGSPALFTDLLVFVPGKTHLDGPLVLTKSKSGDLFGIWYGERLEQKSIHQAENGSVRSNAESQRQHGGDRKARSLGELPKGKLDIAHPIVEPYETVSKIETFLRRMDVAELHPGSAACLFFVEALTLPLVEFEFEMRLDLFGKIVCFPRAFEHAYTSSAVAPVLPPRINSIARLSRCHSLVFSASCSRPFAVRE